MSRVFCVLLAGGSGTRMGADINKVFLPIGGKSCLRRSMEAFQGLIDGMVLVSRSEDEEYVQRELKDISPSYSLCFAPGGSTRQESVLHGLQALPLEENDLALIHDGARCLVSPALIQRVIQDCQIYGSAVPALPVSDTIKRADAEGWVFDAPDRSGLFAMQTPQAFPGRTLLSLEEQAAREGYVGTDDASLFSHAELPVHLTPGERRNLKLTTQEDIQMAETFLRDHFPLFRIGQGYDVHQLVPDRKLILCGVEIPHEKGLLGHSDADVALHALMDAMLGAAALGDIGQHFPDTDPAYAGISSMKLLHHTIALLREHGFLPANVDLTIVAQRPKLKEYIPAMRENLASACTLPLSRVSVKATTTEHLGFEGRMEGISAQAVCMLMEC